MHSHQSWNLFLTGMRLQVDGHPESRALDKTLTQPRPGRSASHGHEPSPKSKATGLVAVQVASLQSTVAYLSKPPEVSFERTASVTRLYTTMWPESEACGVTGVSCW